MPTTPLSYYFSAPFTPSQSSHSAVRSRFGYRKSTVLLFLTVTQILTRSATVVRAQNPNCAASQVSNYIAFYDDCYNQTHTISSQQTCVNGNLTGDIEVFANESLAYPCAALAEDDALMFCHTCGTGRLICANTDNRTAVCPVQRAEVPLSPSSCDEESGTRFRSFSFPPVNETSWQNIVTECSNGRLTNNTSDSDLDTCGNYYTDTPYYYVCRGFYFCADTAGLTCDQVNPPLLAPNCNEAATNYNYFVETCLDDFTIQVGSGQCIDGELVEVDYFITSCADYFGEDYPYCNECGGGKSVCSNVPPQEAICEAASHDPITCPLETITMSDNGTTVTTNVAYATETYPCNAASNLTGAFINDLEICRSGATAPEVFQSEDACSLFYEGSLPYCAQCPGPNGLLYDLCVADDSVSCDALGLLSSSFSPTSAPGASTGTSSPTSGQNSRDITTSAASKTLISWKALVLVSCCVGALLV